MSRDERDYYPTPSWAARLLMRSGATIGLSWDVDPCAGSGALIRAAQGEGVAARGMYGVELDAALAQSDAAFAANVRRGDGLAMSWEGLAVIVNPPYGDLLPWLHKAPTAYAAALLLPVSALGSQKRAAFWAAHPPSYLGFLAQRPSFTGTGSGMYPYVWAGWGLPGGVFGQRIEWLDRRTL